MLVYELASPAVTEYNYWGFLTAEECKRCVRETQLTPEWELYARRCVVVENVCWRFENFHVDWEWRGMYARLGSVCFKSQTPFGATELFICGGS